MSVEIAFLRAPSTSHLELCEDSDRISIELLSRPRMRSYLSLHIDPTWVSRKTLLRVWRRPRRAFSRNPIDPSTTLSEGITQGAITTLGSEPYLPQATPKREDAAEPQGSQHPLCLHRKAKV
ncbi:hypothetical protein HQ37_08350 [Porphyromonas sp. COT-239 OH1446]|nr:hypothetical protein HQ37_08350 [Porphyromonas sp. COT-239 OH1446]